MLTIYTDGSGSNKLKLGAYAYIIHNKDFEIIHKFSDYVINTTTNRMEMMGVLESIKYLNNLEFIGNIEIISDSQYVIYSITKNRTKGKNIDLWKEMCYHHKLFKSRSNNKIKYTWTRGHVGTLYNEMADEMAGLKLKELREKLKNN
jgi:ribonuclease HI